MMRSLFLSFAFALTLLTMGAALEPVSAAPAAPAPMVTVAHIPAAAFMSYGPIYLSADVCCGRWYTLGAIYASQMVGADDIYAIVSSPKTRGSHWRVYWRTSCSPDYHTASQTLCYGMGYTNIGRGAGAIDCLVRADIQINVDSWVGNAGGYVKAAF